MAKITQPTIKTDGTRTVMNLDLAEHVLATIQEGLRTGQLDDRYVYSLDAVGDEWFVRVRDQDGDGEFQGWL